jgi:hypothetical protein
MQTEAPPRYIAFVERNLEPLRRDAARAVGDVHDAERLWPEVLTDVAARWNWLELLGARLGRVDQADRYLRRALARRCRLWRADQEAQPLALMDIQVLGPDATDPWHGTLSVRPEPGPAGAVYEAQPRTVYAPQRRPVRSNAAARLAPHLRPTARAEFGPLAEAGVAWWHAYEAYRRRLLIASLAALFLLVLVGVGLQGTPVSPV